MLRDGLLRAGVARERGGCVGLCGKYLCIVPKPKQSALSTSPLFAYEGYMELDALASELCLFLKSPYVERRQFHPITIT